jgi:limonene-1,2-epoxide hydrolase
MSTDCAVSRVDPRQASPVVLTGVGFSKVAGLRRTRELVRSGREWLKTKLSLEFIDTLNAVATEVLQERMGEGWNECHQA